MTLNDYIDKLHRLRDEPNSLDGDVLVVIQDRKGDYGQAYSPQLILIHENDGRAAVALN